MRGPGNRLPTVEDRNGSNSYGQGLQEGFDILAVAIARFAHAAKASGAPLDVVLAGIAATTQQARRQMRRRLT